MLNVQTVKVCGDIQMEGWEALAKALMKHPCHSNAIFSSKKRMLQARREDLRAIWEAMPERPKGVCSSWRKGFEIPTFKIPMFVIPRNQNTNRPNQNTRYRYRYRAFQNTNRPFQNTNGPCQNTNGPFQNTN